MRVRRAEALSNSVRYRPEAIKLIPVVNRLKAERGIAITVCATAQHRQLLDQVLKLAKVMSDFDLNLMTTNQTLDHLTARLLGHIGEVLDRVRPTRVIVQGTQRQPWPAHWRHTIIAFRSPTWRRACGAGTSMRRGRMGAFGQKRIYGALAWDHEATKLLSAYEKGIQSKMFTKPPATHCRT
jgi:hypothetical protein